MKKLISLRKQEPSFRSLHFHFPGTYQEKRCVEYIKLDEQNHKTEAVSYTHLDVYKRQAEGRKESMDYRGFLAYKNRNNFPGSF